ncbi:MAG TPA: lasso peptide biosynthesis B2 protein [Candidatus Angelobacter sp.]
MLLDIRQGVCLSMTPVAIQIWHMLKRNLSLDQITDCLAADFGEVPKQRISGDVVEFVADLEQKGLLVNAQPSPRCGLAQKLLVVLQGRNGGYQESTRRKAKTPHFLVLKALLGLLFFDLFRFGRNFTKTHGLVQSWRIAPISTPANTVELVCRAVNYACVWYPKRVLCLQRSVVTTCLLRSCGIQAQMVMGAQKFPFKAHAWTEVEGHAINERRDVQSIYMVWERC